jgi:methionyl-tRNA synthetase
MPSQLELPVASEPLALSQVVKALLAVGLYDSSIKVVGNDANAFPVLKVENEGQLIEANAMVRYLSKAKLSSKDEEFILYEETVLYDALKRRSKLDEKTCQDLSSRLQNGDINAVNIIIFSALQGLVSFVGKGALSQDLQLLLWYQKFSGNPRVQTALKNLNQFTFKEEGAASAPTSRVASAVSAQKPAAAAAAAAAPAEKKPEEPKSEAPPPPERTGEIKVMEDVKVKKQGDKILPKQGEKNILITSALPYVNNVPHLGNIVGSVLSADIFARYAKARNYNALYICGTDEYGTATETKALEEKMSPYDLCTKYYTIHKDVYDWFQIGFDHFGRTSTEKQTEIAQGIFLKLHENGYLDGQTTEQLYCTKHEGYLADRFVEGTCPKCGYEDARGDQCDKCGQLLNPFELIEPRCKLDNEKPEKRNTKHVFLSLDKLQEKVEKWCNESQETGHWSKNGKTITQNWFKEGLRPRAITRDLKWGVPVPLEEYKDKVLYVWFDACIGYVSITAAYTDEWEKWWKDPENVKLYQFMGKDNVPFHSVIFPSCQIGTNEEWTMLNTLSTTEYLQYEGGKFSKSRGLGVFGNNAKDIGLSPSVWRYYLACARPETSDSQFSWSDFVSRNNNELLANLGNFVNRLVKFVNSSTKYNGVIPEYNPEKALGEVYTNFKKDVDGLLSEYVSIMDDVQLRRGLEIAMQVSARGNQFLQENKLDNNLFLNTPEKSHAVISVGLNLIYILSAILTPYMPETSESILDQLNAPARSIPEEFDMPLLPGHNIGKAKYLFKRIEDSKIDEWRQKYGGQQQK